MVNIPVIALFAGDPFPGEPPQQIRAVLWQCWFTDWKDKRAGSLVGAANGSGCYAPTLERAPSGKIEILKWPGTQAPSPDP